MGKLYVISGYIIYFTAKCVQEGICHIHVDIQMRGNKSLSKLWIYSDGACSIEYNRGVPNHIMNQVIAWVSSNFYYITNAWDNLSNDWGYKSK